MKHAQVVLLLAFALAIAFTTTISHAQSAASANWSSASDLQVMLQAIESVPPSPADSVIREGTFWSAQHAPGTREQWPPFPGNINEVPVWDLGDGCYLLDDLEMDYQATSMQAINAPYPNWEGGPNSDGGLYFGMQRQVFTTNELWLEMTNVSGGLAHLNLHNGTNQVYAIWTTMDLRTAWAVEMELWPTDANCTPFTLATQNRQSLFVRVEDWTGVTDNGNQIPDWWFWKYFGKTALSDTNLDTAGNTLLFDYTNGIAPANIINFTLRLGNGHFNTPSAPGSFLTVSGIPAYEAVLVNDANLNDAVWQPFDGIVRLNLGPTDGVYQVWCGLKGFAGSQPQWIGTLVYLDRVPPQVFLASPTNSITACPVLQLQGWSPEELSGVSYGLSNTLAVLTNQSGLLTSSWLDINTGVYTTNNFQCFDVPLTNGPNLVTLRAIDLAGNVTTSNLSVTLDYSAATNPVIQLTWPTSGMQICQNAFTLRGWTEDSLAQVCAQIVDADGNTNFITGAVERNGRFWVENIPLGSGTNWLTCRVTNSAGLSSTTNLTLIQSSVTLTLDSAHGDLWLPTVSASGHVSDTTAVVWVNGVQGSNNGDGTWSAVNVPATPGGVASFDLKAILSGGGGPDANVNKDKTTGIVMESANGNYDMTQDAQTLHMMGNWGWSRENGGYRHSEFHPGTDWNKADETIGTDMAIINTHITGSDGTDTNFANTGQASFAQEIGSVSTNSYLTLPDGSSLLWSTFSETVKVKMFLHTGGKSGVGKQALMAVYASATDEITGLAIPYEEITLAGKNLGTDGWAYKEVEMGTPVDVTPQAKAQIYSFSGPDGGVHIPSIVLSTSTTSANLDFATPEVCVGQKTTLTVVWDSDPGAANAEYNWNFSSQFVNHSWQGNSGGSVNYDISLELLKVAQPYAWWYSRGNKNAHLNETLHFSNGQSVTVSPSGQFNVFRPTIAMADPAYHGIPMNIWRIPWNVSRFGEIGLGQVGGPNNMSYLVRVTSSDFSGDAKITQLCSIDATALIDLNISGYLDNSDPYKGATAHVYKNPNPQGTINEMQLDDAPSDGWVYSFHDHSSFVDYIMFTPGGLGDIYVTLGKITWGTSFAASYPSTNISPNSINGPSSPDDSNAFPAWTNIFLNQ
jgi:hypothetical protein